MGVPKLAAKAVALADEVQRLRRELYKQDEHHGRYFITKELDAQREQIAAWFDRNQSEDMKNICLLCASRAAADIRARKDEAIGRFVSINNADEHLAALAADYEAVHDSLRAEIATLTGVIDAIVNEPVSMLLAQAAGLVRLVGPDDWPADAIPRPPVVDMAMRVKDAADMQRTIARDRRQHACE